MSQDEQKRLAAQAALDFIESGDIVGVGTGSTTNFFIDALAGVKGKIDGVVSSSEASADRLEAIGRRELVFTGPVNWSLSSVGRAGPLDRL